MALNQMPGLFRWRLRAENIYLPNIVLARQNEFTVKKLIFANGIKN